jgi:outer membrane protein OmpA-like peptidoglycan-associated protein
MKGVEPERIDVEGRGADQPITHAGQCDKLSAKARAACMAPDRRVEIVVTRSFAKKKSDFQASR